MVSTGCGLLCPKILLLLITHSICQFTNVSVQGIETMLHKLMQDLEPLKLYLVKIHHMHSKIMSDMCWMIMGSCDRSVLYSAAISGIKSTLVNRGSTRVRYWKRSLIHRIFILCIGVRLHCSLNHMIFSVYFLGYRDTHPQQSWVLELDQFDQGSSYAYTRLSKTSS